MPTLTEDCFQLKPMPGATAQQIVMMTRSPGDEESMFEDPAPATARKAVEVITNGGNG